jgi:hypothetical protein
MFSLLRCLTAVSSQCKAEAAAVFVAGPSTARYSGNWLDAGDAALTGAPDLMDAARDAVKESVADHGINVVHGEIGAHQGA